MSETDTRPKDWEVADHAAQEIAQGLAQLTVGGASIRLQDGIRDALLFLRGEAPPLPGPARPLGHPFTRASRGIRRDECQMLVDGKACGQPQSAHRAGSK